MAVAAGERDDWLLGNIAYYTSGCVGKLVCDTGAAATIVSHDFIKRCGLLRDIQTYTGHLEVTLPDGRTMRPSGMIDLPLTVQLLIDVEGCGPVHWDRSFVLRGVTVLDLGDAPPRDLYVSWRDFAFSSGSAAPVAPLGHLAHMITRGARVVDARRVTSRGSKRSEPLQVVARSTAADVPALSAAGGTTTTEMRGERTVYDIGEHTEATHSGEGGMLGALSTAGSDTEKQSGGGGIVAASSLTDDETATAKLRADIDGRIAETHRNTPAAKALTAAMLARPRLFGELDTNDCTEVIEFTLVEGVAPKEVSFKVPFSRKAGEAVYHEALGGWEQRGVVRKVPWDTKSYGFAIMVPKPNGKWRLTINPTGINKSTERIEPEGGFMPANMLLEAQRCHGRKIAIKMDMREAFVTFKLGEMARRLSTFSTPIGKYQWLHGYFGWHSFPAAWQKLVMTRVVVLPTLDEFDVSILCWIDDIVVAADSEEVLIAAFTAMMDRMQAFGGRVSIPKSEFFVTRFDFCGVEADLVEHQWRIAPGRVSSLMATPVPKDRETLSYAIGLIRYYFWGVLDQKSQRDRLELLRLLDEPHVVLSRTWTEAHTAAYRGALEAITKGDWLLVYDPRQPVTVETDASSKFGYCVTAHQSDLVSGRMRPIAFISKGWAGPQCTWMAQV